MQFLHPSLIAISKNNCTLRLIVRIECSYKELLIHRRSSHMENRKILENFMVQLVHHDFRNK